MYVPSTVNEHSVSLTDWTSFMSVWVNPGYWQYAYPITVDADTGSTGYAPQILMNVQPMINSTGCPGWSCATVYQSSPVDWPFNQWFEVSLVGYLHPGSTSTFTVYQNGVQIITWSGVLPDEGEIGTHHQSPTTFDALSNIHLGLYAGPDQGNYAIYNDDVAVYNLGSSTASTASGQTYIAASSSILLGAVGAVVVRPARKRLARQTDD